MTEEYPRNPIELEAAFSTEAACRDYLARLRWPNGFRCPGCGYGKAWPVRNFLFQCAACGYQTSVTTGTIFQDTRTPLPVWFRAMWWVTTQKNVYQHDVTYIKRNTKTASELLPRVHLVISLLKRWMMGTHQGAIQEPGQALFPTRATSRGRRSSNPGPNYSSRCESRGETTTCWGYLSQADS